MGAERARLIVALQSALMHAAREFGGEPRFEEHRTRVLATAAALDYALMLASGTAGVRIAEREADRAIRDGLARAVDALIAVSTTIAEMGTPEAGAFARSTARALSETLREEGLERDDRRFAVIALANA